MAKQIWFITGASAGLGRAMTEHVLAQGDIAVATCRKPEALEDLKSRYSASQLLVIKLDVTNPLDVKNSFSEVQKKFGRIDVVYSNAAYGILGEVEGTPDDVARQLFEVNFWGAINVTKKAIQFFREVNNPVGGRLLIASSYAATSAMMNTGYYCASKSALDGIHASLAQELDPDWNIKAITLIVLGGFLTRGLTKESLVTLPVHSAYGSAPSGKAREAYANPEKSQHGDPKKAAREMYKMAKDFNLGLRVPLGLDATAVVAGRAEEVSIEAEAGRFWSADVNLE